MAETEFQVAQADHNGDANSDAAWPTYPPDGSAGTGAQDAGVLLGIHNTYTTEGGGQYSVESGFVRWDTSSIPDSATIFAASLILQPNSGPVVTDSDIRVVVSWWTDWYPLTSADADSGMPANALPYANGLAVSSLSSGVDSELDLVDFSGISKTGITALKIDFMRSTNAAPTGVNACAIKGRGTGAAVGPRLVVVYGTPQYAYPDADTDASTWTATPLWQKVDEAGTPSDADFITATAT